MIPKGRVHVEDYPGRYNHHAMAYDPAVQPPSSLSLPYSCLGASPELCISMDSSLSSGGEFANSLKAMQETDIFNGGLIFIFSLKQRSLSIEFSKPIWAYHMLLHSKVNILRVLHLFHL